MTPRTRRSVLLIVGSLLLATGAAVIANRWLVNRVDASRMQSVMVVAAATDIAFGSVIDQRQLKMVAMLANEAPPNNFTDINAVTGKIAKSDIYTDEPLTERRVAKPGVGSTLAALVTPTMRAVSIRVDDVVGVSGFILPGNRVDVTAARSEGSRAWAETILSDVKVLAVDQQASADKNAPVVVRAVTIEVTPEGVQKLAKAKQLGSLQLSLRNPADKTAVLAAPLTPMEEPGWLSSILPPVPAVAAAQAAQTGEHKSPVRVAGRHTASTSTEPVISVIRGTDVTSQPAH